MGDPTEYSRFIGPQKNWQLQGFELDMAAEADGSVWIGTSKGLTHFLHPATDAARPADPPVVLTWLRLGDVAVPLEGDFAE